ncbi:hypothetical protein AtubIFM57258_003984 [Aspergillus tubingensis]|nr:hypothetical protein AtubIFM57258_003984 [Aspergillus tubingensis]
MLSSSTIQNDSPGSLCDIFNLYQTKPDNRGRASWTKELPENLVEPAEGAESSSYAIIVRNIKCYDGRKSLTIHSIVLQSEPLKKFPTPVMAGYPGLTMSLDRIEFTKPFKPFVHRWEKSTAARESEQDSTTKAHVDLLYGLLESELHDTISRKSDLISNGVVTHALLWTLFQPGDIVFSVLDNRPRAFICGTGDMDSRSGTFVLNGKYIDFDGDKFGFSTHEFQLEAFEGTCPITDLSVAPLAYHKNRDAIEKELLLRGSLWESLRGYHYKQYDGVGKGYLFGREVKLNITSRIVIDTAAYITFNPHEEFHLSNTITAELSEVQRMIATPMLRGYALKDKKWLEFFVDNVTDITWNAQAFQSLVLPDNQQHLKKLILAVAKSKSYGLEVFDDVVQGKGRGVIMLLRGPPGVGKTLTAEGVAEVMKVPLYVLSAADLGTSPSRVEERLKDVLSIVPKWGAVLLLDEADVFMEARNSTDLARNELVSIFLRVLEYYEGILFLTSNRAENMDPAFESRIHVSICYPELTEKTRRQIWMQFLAAPNVEIFSNEQLDEIAKVELNGRQIKNVLRTAHLLAQEENTSVGYEDVQTILSLRSV